MARYKVNVSEAAENDLRDIVRYTSARLGTPAIALKMIDIIAATPQRFPPVADERISSMGYRKMITKSLIVFFTIDEKNQIVDVERILYARRDWLRIL